MRTIAIFTLTAIVAVTAAACGNEAYDRTYQLTERLWTEIEDYQDEVCLEYMFSPEEFSREMLDQVVYEFESADQQAVADFLTEKCGSTDARTRTSNIVAFLWSSMEDFQEYFCSQHAIDPEAVSDELLQEIKRDFEEADPQIVSEFLAEQCE
ncbi:MAG: hypothetical protein L0H03_20740 [Rhodococcus sp. (in: high G+C Gram-positive bacteria)]|nr:hypothetical protein [Rhodococcus sp. (in: high G+C Gram-positive bacteria)]